MGREIRRVPAHHDHPRMERRPGEYQPTYDREFAPVFNEWLANFDRLRRGDLTDLEHECYPRGLSDWLLDEGRPPDSKFYRNYALDEATWFQMYETVSEGTPVSPPFATKAELVDYLVVHGDFWSQKRRTPPLTRGQYEAFVEAAWAPSFVSSGGHLKSGVEAAEQT